MDLSCSLPVTARVFVFAVLVPVPAGIARAQAPAAPMTRPSSDPHPMMLVESYGPLEKFVHDTECRMLVGTLQQTIFKTPSVESYVFDVDLVLQGKRPPGHVTLVYLVRRGVLPGLNLQKGARYFLALKSAKLGADSQDGQTFQPAGPGSHGVYWLRDDRELQEIKTLVEQYRARLTGAGSEPRTLADFLVQGLVRSAPGRAVPSQSMCPPTPTRSRS